MFDYHIKTNPFGEKPKNELAEAKRKAAINRQNLKLDLMQIKARQANKERLKENG